MLNNYEPGRQISTRNSAIFRETYVMFAQLRAGEGRKARAGPRSPFARRGLAVSLGGVAIGQFDLEQAGVRGRANDDTVQRDRGAAALSIDNCPLL